MSTKIQWKGRHGNSACLKAWFAPSDREGYSRWQAELTQLCSMSEAQLARIDIVDLNFFCAAGLPGAEGVDPATLLAKLAAWTKYIARNIEHWRHEFLNAPRQGEDSPGKFRMLSIASLLQRQLGVHYNLSFMEGEYDGRDSRNLFIHGILSGHGGTCASLPVLHTAIARRLGYPLFLVAAKGHLLARWEEPAGERFNVECAVRGFLSWPDEKYRSFPEVIPDEGVRNRTFLCSMTRREELALFLNERGNCLLDHMRIGEALEAYYHAHRIAPYNGCIRGNWIIASIMHRTIENAKREAGRRARRASTCWRRGCRSPAV